MNKTFLWKKLPVVVAMAALAWCSPERAGAEEKAAADSTMNTVLLKTLRKRRADLKKEIEAADRKRGRTIEGVAAGTLELMNTAQDSLCLELRSELVRVELEIKELTPAATPAQVMQYYNAMHGQNAAPARKTARP